MLALHVRLCVLRGDGAGLCAHFATPLSWRPRRNGGANAAAPPQAKIKLDKGDFARLASCGV